MENIIEKIEWNLSDGRKVSVEIELRLEKKINLDGWKSTVECCEIWGPTAEVEGEAMPLTDYRKLSKPVTKGDKTIVAAIDNLGLTADQDQLIEDAIARIKNHPAWVAKQERAAKNQAEIRAMENRRRQSGLCPECGTYCHGDCGAN
jgi:hypothetical protein